MLESRLAIIVSGLTLVAALGCGSDPAAEPSAAAAPTAESAPALARLDPPSGPGAMAPSLWSGSHGVLLVWLEPVETGHRLMMSRLEGDVWRNPIEVVRGEHFFANWADTPTVVEAADGTLYSHWLEKLGEGTYAYGVQLAMSEDGGANWQPIGLLHDDRSEVEHGFVSMVPAGEGVTAVWLDGRAMKDDGPMQLRAARIAGREVSEAEVLERSVCECCATAMTRAEAGPVVAFRGRTSGEIRDIGVARHTDRGWQAPSLVHEDGWEIPGCPVNGPAIAADGGGVTVAWFTAAGGSAEVKAAFSADGGRSFGPPVLLDDAAPLGRVGVVRIGDEAFVSWVAASASGEEGAEIRLQRLAADGVVGAAKVVALTTPARAAGVPRLVRDKDRLLVAWVEAISDQPSIVHVSVVPLLG